MDSVSNQGNTGGSDARIESGFASGGDQPDPWQSERDAVFAKPAGSSEQNEPGSAKNSTDQSSQAAGPESKGTQSSAAAERGESAGSSEDLKELKKGNTNGSVEEPQALDSNSTVSSDTPKNAQEKIHDAIEKGIDAFDGEKNLPADKMDPMQDMDSMIEEHRKSGLDHSKLPPDTMAPMQGTEGLNEEQKKSPLDPSKLPPDTMVPMQGMEGMNEDQKKSALDPSKMPEDIIVQQQGNDALQKGGMEGIEPQIKKGFPSTQVDMHSQVGGGSRPEMTIPTADSVSMQQLKERFGSSFSKPSQRIDIDSKH